MSAVAIPSVSDLPYHSDKMPSTTAEAVDAIAKILKFEPFHTTKKDEYTLNTLCGVMLYRHLDQPTRNRVMEMIVNKDHIAPIDWGELRTKCTDVLVQPLWGLWSLTTPELESIIKDQERTAAIFTLLGYGASVSSVADFIKSARKNLKDGKTPFKGQTKNIAIFLISTTWSHVNAKQLANSKEEMDRRMSNPKSSSYHN